MPARKVVDDFVAVLVVGVGGNTRGAGHVRLYLSAPLVEDDRQIDPESFAPQPVALDETCLADEMPSPTTPPVTTTTATSTAASTTTGP